MHDGRLSSLGLLRSFVPSPSPELPLRGPDSVPLLKTQQSVLEPIDSLRKLNLAASQREIHLRVETIFTKATNPDKATFYPICLEPPGS